MYYVSSLIGLFDLKSFNSDIMIVSSNKLGLCYRSLLSLNFIIEKIIVQRFYISTKCRAQYWSLACHSQEVFNGMKQLRLHKYAINTLENKWKGSILKKTFILMILQLRSYGAVYTQAFLYVLLCLSSV